MRREATDIKVKMVVKYIDEEGKLVGTTESVEVVIPRTQFEENVLKLVHDLRLSPIANISGSWYRKMFVKLFQRWIVDKFLNVG